MRTIEKLLTAVSGILILWVLASWVDVVAHNTTTCIYASWNLFELLF